MIDNLFNIQIENSLRLSITPNEIYNQFLLYMLFVLKKNIVVVTPNLTDANDLYINLKKYVEKRVYIFPEDDYLTKKAIASSPDLMYMRMKFLNNINYNDTNILICHTSSFLKKLPRKEKFYSRRITIKKNDKLDRKKFINELIEIGYKKESLVTNTGEFSVRGFIIDIFPIFEEHPVRLELFDDEIEEIKTFNEDTQLSIKALNDVIIKPLIDEYNDSLSNVLDYINNPVVVYQDYNQIVNVEKSVFEEMKNYDDYTSIHKLKEITNDYNIFVDTIDNSGNYDIVLESSNIENYNGKRDEFLSDIKKYNGFLCTTDISFLKSLNIDKDRIIKQDINRGFVYNNTYYYSKNDLYPVNIKLKYDTGYKYGKRVDSIDKLEIGDYVVHRANGIGVYGGIKTITKNGVNKDYILIKYKGNDKLYLSIDKVDKLYKYSSKDGAKPVIHKLNSLEWQKTKLKVKNKIHDITENLIKIYKERNLAKVIPFDDDTPEQTLFENEFIYEETPDQIKTTIEIKKDLESFKPMDRLLCGDVGYGKTEVVFRAMFKAVMNLKQVAYLCPTTLLSYQQYSSALDRFKNYGVNIALLNRYTSVKESKEIIQNLKDGKIDIIFGTHRLLSSDIEFKDLGLLVIDEEQRFGVMHKEKIKQLKSNVHVLSVSATPIPRSLQMSLIGIRDLSLIETPPKSKLPVQTYVINYDVYLIREIILKEKARNGQVFILYNKIEDMSNLVDSISKLVPEISIKHAHGKMKKEQMQDILYEFSMGLFDCLISTTIIENGIDIPNANTMIIIDADRFGLSQLYQIRGRVGRSDRQAYCYLMYNKGKVLTETAIKRLEAIKEFTELGSGYKIAMRDLSIRGAGDIMGSEQSGFIDSVGVDLYMELINEELNGIEEESLKENDILLDDASTHIGREYSDDDGLIIDLHKKIAEIDTIKDLNDVYNELTDRFGVVSESIKEYMYQELCKKIINRFNITIIPNDRNKISLKIEESIYKHLNIEKLFIETVKINNKFNFQYKANAIIISLNKINLDKNYIYYIFDLLCLIDREINKK